MTARNTCHVCFTDEHLSPEWCPHVWIDAETGVRVFSPPALYPFGSARLLDTGDAYDFSQTCDDVRDGDIIVCEHDDRQIVAIMVEAWPTALSGYDEDLNAGAIHVLEHATQWDTLDGGKYVRSVEAAHRWVDRDPTSRCSSCGELLDVERDEIAEVVRDDQHVIVHVSCMREGEAIA